MDAQGSLQASVTLRNAGDVAGDEIVQLYVQDAAGCVVRPVKELKGFCRVHLEPGEETTVSISLGAEQLRFHDFENKLISEPGLYRIWMGADSGDALMDTFQLVD
jgi:hypothetical protein